MRREKAIKGQPQTLFEWYAMSYAEWKNSTQVLACSKCKTKRTSNCHPKSHKLSLRKEAATSWQEKADREALPEAALQKGSIPWGAQWGLRAGCATCMCKAARFISQLAGLLGSH